MTASGSGATNGAGIVWFTTNVWTDPRRASGSSTNFALPHDDAVRVDRRRCVDGPAVDAARTEQPEHLVGAAHELRALGRHAHLDGLARRDELPARAQHLGVAHARARR